MHTPPELQPRLAPPPPEPARCSVTGVPARYRDPQTRLPYATLDAYRELQRRKAAGLVAAPALVAPAATAWPLQPATGAAADPGLSLQHEPLLPPAAAAAQGVAAGRPQRQAAAAAQSLLQQQQAMAF